MPDLARDLLRGAADLHIHAAPDILPRLLDDFGLARAARDAGMAAIVLKSHHMLTADRAQVAQTMFPEVRVFGGLALILAVVGIYGVKAYAVARRTREIGIRMALGAEPGAVLRLILRESLVMALSGVALGFLLALGIGRALSSMLYQVSPVDPVAFTLSPAVLIATALFACWLPARRAAKVDPMVALRAE